MTFIPPRPFANEYPEHTAALRRIEELEAEVQKLRDGAPAPVPAAPELSSPADALYLSDLAHDHAGQVKAASETIEHALRTVAVCSYERGLAAALPHVPSRKDYGVYAPEVERELSADYTTDVAAHAPSPPTGWQPKLLDAAEMLWIVLANVSGGDWTQQSQEWQDAAARWRDNYFDVLRQMSAPLPAPVAPHEDK